jgi:hypothetical protein
MFSLQVFGAVRPARAGAGFRAHEGRHQGGKARGKVPGNPRLREHRREAIRTIAAEGKHVFLGDLIASAPTWLPTVQRMRPQLSAERNH